MNQPGAVVEVLEEEGTDADFDAGFADAETGPTERPEPKEADAGEEAPAAAVAAEPAAQPKYVQITEEQYQNLLTQVNQIPEIKANMDKGLSTAFGKIGGTERTLNELRNVINSTGELNLSDEEIEALEFPEVARDLIPVLKKLRGGGSGKVDPAEYEAIAEKVADRREVKLNLQILDGMHKGWKEIIGVPVNDVVPKTAYRDWLATQSEDYQNRINFSKDAFEIGDSITTFNDAQAKAKADADAATKAATAAAEAAANTRRGRLRGAVTPKGTGEHAPGSTGDDEFDAGVRESLGTG